MKQLIVLAIDYQEDVEMICCDLSKTFDAVKYELLLRKLKGNGVWGGVNRLFQSYTADLCCQLEGATLDKKTTRIGCTAEHNFLHNLHK